MTYTKEGLTIARRVCSDCSSAYKQKLEALFKASQRNGYVTTDIRSPWCLAWCLDGETRATTGACCYKQPEPKPTEFDLRPSLP